MANLRRQAATGAFAVAFVVGTLTTSCDGGGTRSAAEVTAGTPGPTSGAFRGPSASTAVQSTSLPSSFPPSVGLPPADESLPAGEGAQAQPTAATTEGESSGSGRPGVVKKGGRVSVNKQKSSGPSNSPAARSPAGAVGASASAGQDVPPNQSSRLTSQHLTGAGQFMLTSTVGSAQRSIDGPYLTYVTNDAQPVWFVGRQASPEDDPNNPPPVLNVRLVEGAEDHRSVSLVAVTTPYRSDGSGSITFTWDFAASQKWLDLPVGGKSASPTSRGDYTVVFSRPAADRYVFEASGMSGAYFSSFRLTITGNSFSPPIKHLRYDLSGSGRNFSVVGSLNLTSS